jgi:hypothetical protein
MLPSATIFLQLQLNDANRPWNKRRELVHHLGLVCALAGIGRPSGRAEIIPSRFRRS